MSVIFNTFNQTLFSAKKVAQPKQLNVIGNPDTLTGLMATHFPEVDSIRDIHFLQQGAGIVIMNHPSKKLNQIATKLKEEAQLGDDAVWKSVVV